MAGALAGDMRSECSNLVDWLGRAQDLVDTVAEWERLALTPGTTHEQYRQAYLNIAYHTLYLAGSYERLSRALAAVRERSKP